MDMKSFVTLTDLLQKAGPFAFSLLFLFIVSRWGQRKYQEACDRDPPASDQQRHVYLGYFIGTTFIGVILVALSIWWWWNHQNNYLYEGRIEGVQEIISVEGDNFFVQNVYSKPTRDAVQIVDRRFIVVSKEPFAMGDSVPLHLTRDNNPTRSDIELPILLDSKTPRFKLDYQNEKGWKLISNNLASKELENSPPTGSLLVGAAYAEGITQPPALLPSPPPNINYQLPAALTLRKSVANSRYQPAQPNILGVTHVDKHYSALLNSARSLVDSKVLVSEKIQTIDAMLTTPQELVDKLLFEDVNNEPLFLDVMDLARHTDKELAFKARRLVESSQSPLEWFLINIPSTNKNVAEHLLYRVDPSYAKSVIAAADANGVKISKKVRQHITVGDKTRLLVPTGTSRGDRFYVQAQWPSGDEDSIKCIAKLFNTSVANNRTLARELELMRTTKVRIAYDETKAWPLDMASHIEKCGGKATFVGYYAP